MREISLKELLEAGCHFGHQANRWHPKAGGFIFGERDGVHVIDLAKTKAGLVAAAEYLKNLAQSGGTVVFVGTKRQAKIIVEENANKANKSNKTSNFYCVLERWPGGLLTNFDIIKKNNLDAIVKLEQDLTADVFVTKKEKLLAQRKLDKYKKAYGGLVGLTKIPDAIFLVDIKKEDGALREALRTNTTVVAITDTNTNPEAVKYGIPANDDAIGSIKIIVDYLADAWTEGLKK